MSSFSTSSGDTERDRKKCFGLSGFLAHVDVAVGVITASLARMRLAMT